MDATISPELLRCVHEKPFATFWCGNHSTPASGFIVAVVPSVNHPATMGLHGCTFQDQHFRQSEKRSAGGNRILVLRSWNFMTARKTNDPQKNETLSRPSFKVDICCNHVAKALLCEPTAGKAKHTACVTIYRTFLKAQRSFVERVAQELALTWVGWHHITWQDPLCIE